MALAVVLAALIVLIDQATKSLAETLLDPGVFVALLGDSVGWQLVYNPGGAFGVAAPSWIFMVVTVVVLVLVVRVLPRTDSHLQAVAFGFLLAGAVGNAIDRLFRVGDDHFGGGYVVDFVAWGAFPRFNVADSSITVGLALTVLALWLEERRGRRTDSDADPQE